MSKHATGEVSNHITKSKSSTSLQTLALQCVRCTLRDASLSQSDQSKELASTHGKNADQFIMHRNPTDLQILSLSANADNIFTCWRCISCPEVLNQLDMQVQSLYESNWKCLAEEPSGYGQQGYGLQWYCLHYLTISLLGNRIPIPSQPEHHQTSIHAKQILVEKFCHFAAHLSCAPPAQISGCLTTLVQIGKVTKDASAKLQFQKQLWLHNPDNPGYLGVDDLDLAFPESADLADRVAYLASGVFGERSVGTTISFAVYSISWVRFKYC